MKSWLIGLFALGSLASYAAWLEVQHELETSNVTGSREYRPAPTKCLFMAGRLDEYDTHDDSIEPIYTGFINSNDESSINFRFDLEVGQVPLKEGSLKTLSSASKASYKNGVFLYEKSYKEDGVTEKISIEMKVSPDFTPQEIWAKETLKKLFKTLTIKEIHCKF